jgi:hypothetical protein
MVGIAKKSGSVLESEVYREMERQAVRKGFFKPSDERMVKMASQQVGIKKEAKASGDLMVDVAVLAENLRERGFMKRAEELEKKLVLFKQAEVHMYHVHDEEGEDVLNWAHREGDVEIVPAQEGRGRVETVQSAAKKILEIVRKQPSGKVSNASLRKSAQPFQTTQVVGGGGEKKSNTQATAALGGFWARMKNERDNALAALKLGVSAADGKPIYYFTETRLLGTPSNEYLTLYQNYTGVNPRDIATFKQNVSNVFPGSQGIPGGAQWNQQTLMGVISKTPWNNVQGITAWGRQIDPKGGFDNYFWGSSPSKSWAVRNISLQLGDAAKARFRDNPNAIWVADATGGFSLDPGRVDALARRMMSMMEARRKGLFGPIDAANAKVSTQIRSATDPLRGINFDSPPAITEDEQSTTQANQALDVIGKAAGSYNEGQPNMTALNSIITVFDGEAMNGFKARMVAFGQEWGKSKKYIAQTAPGSLGKEVDEGSANSISAKFKAAGSLWDKYVAAKPDERSEYADNTKSSMELANMVANSANKAYFNLYSQISGLPEFAGAKSPQALSRAADEWLAATRQATGIRQA